MIPNWIRENLCYYDTRNPDAAPIEEDEEDLRGPHKAEDCFCDNCYYGRTKLAEYIICRLENNK